MLQTSRFSPIAEFLVSAAVVGASTAIAVLLRHRLEPSTFAMLYLLGVVLVAMNYRRIVATVHALVSVSAFYYFCVPIHDSFVFEDSNYILTVVAMLVVALVISTLTFKNRAQAAEAAGAQIAIETERTRNLLLSAVSHDIKTPLSSIYGAATSLLVEEDRLVQAERHELIQSIADEAERLNQVVTNLLEMTRLSASPEIKCDWYPLEEIIGAALANSEKALLARTVTIDIPDDLPMVRVDAVLMEQLFINLLENAAKYTPPGSQIQISATLHVERVVIFVRDNGPGFPPGQEQQVFEKFFRGKTEGIRGVGLGLAICRTIMDRHHGTISAANAGSGGAVVTIELPVGGAPPAVGALPESSLT